MSGIAAKWAIRRYSPGVWTSLGEGGAIPLSPKGKEQIYDDWRAVVEAADVIVGDNDLKMGVQPSDPVVIKHGDDVVLIYIKLEV